MLLLFCGFVTVYCLGAGFDPGFTNFGAILWNGFLLSTTLSYFFFYSATNGEVIVVVGFFVILVFNDVLLSLYLSRVDFVVL